MKLRELIMMAGAYADLRWNDYAMNDIIEFERTWTDLLDTNLEDLHLSKLNLEEQDYDYLSIKGVKL